MIAVEEYSSSGSDSEFESLKFDIDAFKKYPHTSTKPIQSDQENSLQVSCSLDAGEDLDQKATYINFYPENESETDKIQRQKKNLKDILEENLKKSIVCQPGFEKLEKVPVFRSKRQITKARLKERDKTKGFGWYHMPAPEMTEEKKNDLAVLQMRKALDPKHFYKRSAVKITPKYFQVGTVVDAPIDFYSSRIPKKQRKQTLVDELMADVEFRQYQKRKVAEAMKSQPMKYSGSKKAKKNKLKEARLAASKKKQKKGKKHKK